MEEAFLAMLAWQFARNLQNEALYHVFELPRRSLLLCFVRIGFTARIGHAGSTMEAGVARVVAI